MSHENDPTSTYGSAAAARTAAYDSALPDKTYAYVDSKEAAFRSRTINLKIGDSVRLNDRDYGILSIISEGTGEAVIYKIADAHQNTLALKLYFEFSNPKEEPNLETLKRIKSITDSDILKLHDFGVGPARYMGKYCFEISDFAEGGDLFAVDDLAAHYTPEYLETTITREIFNGIKKLHSYKVYHCDLKPWNILYLDKARRDIVIADYGSGKAFDLEAEKDARKTSTVKGTEAYLSPEQGRGIISEKNDYYSFGVILLHLLYPKYLARDSDPRQIDKEKFERIVERQYASQPIIEYDSRYRRLNTLIEGLTLLNHHNRWGSAQVEKWLKGEQVEVRYKGFESDNVQPVKLGYATIRSSRDFIDVIETNPKGYQDLIEDQDTYTTVKSWLDSYRDVPTRKAFDKMVRFHQPLGKAFVKEAMLRFFEPQRPITLDTVVFQFFESKDVEKDVARFIAKLDEMWKFTPLEQLRFYLFQIEFSLNQLHSSAPPSAALVAALIDKLYSVFDLTSKPFDNFITETPAKINPKEETVSFDRLLTLFYRFNPKRGFRDSNHGAIHSIQEVGMFFARNEPAFTNKFLAAERKRYLEETAKAGIAKLDFVQWIFEVFKDKANTDLELEKLTFDKGRNFQISYKFAKTLNPYFHGRGVSKNFTVRSSGETHRQKRKFLQGFSAVWEDFLNGVTSKHGIATLSAENIARTRRTFLRACWKRYLWLYWRHIALSFLLILVSIFIATIVYGLKQQKLHVDRLLGITWMDNSEYQQKYREAYTSMFLKALKFKDIKLYTGGNERPEFKRRHYQDQFDFRRTKLIYVQVDFSHARPGQRVDFAVHGRLLRDGVEIAQATNNSWIETEWVNSYHGLTFGENRVRNWAKGKYTLEIKVNNQFVGARGFIVN